MSAGIEVAGLVLAIFPAVIGLVDWYGDRVSGRDMKFLAERLENNKIMFLNTLDHLLLSVVPPHEAGTLLRDPDGNAWKDAALNNRIINHLGPAADRILDQIAGIYTAVLKLQQKLPPRSRAVKDKSVGERAKEVVKAFAYGPHYRGSLERLKIRVIDFRTLVDDALKLASSQTGMPTFLRHLDLVRDCADCLYDALQAGWTFNCEDEHPANLQLELWPMTAGGSKADKDGLDFKFSFLFAPDVEGAQFDHWMVAEIAMSKKDAGSSTVVGSVQSGSSALVTSPVSTTMDSYSSSTSTAASDASSTTSTIIEDLCAEFNGPRGRTHGQRRRLSSVSRSKVHDYQLFIEPDPKAAARTKSSLKLAETFEQPGTLSRKNKMKLAWTLACGVLQISSTSWLRGKWTKENVLLVMDDANKPLPYLSHVFHSARRSSQSSTLTPATSNQVVDWVKNATLFALGVFLLEVCYNRSIEDLASVKEKSQKGEPWSYTPVLTAMRISKVVSDEMGMDYAQAVDACLNFPSMNADAGGKPQGSLEFAKKIMRDIIEPLKRAADYYGE